MSPCVIKTYNIFYCFLMKMFKPTRSNTERYLWMSAAAIPGFDWKTSIRRRAWLSWRQGSRWPTKSLSACFDDPTTKYRIRLHSPSGQRSLAIRNWSRRRSTSSRSKGIPLVEEEREAGYRDCHLGTCWWHFAQFWVSANKGDNRNLNTVIMSTPTRY